jgi:DNA-binding FadR family transcriptional regulator
VRPSRVPYLEVAAEIREQIRSGRLAPGDRLKTVRALAAEYSVAQGTVGSALEVLRGEGLIETVHGKGSVVVASPDEASQPIATDAASAMREMEARLSAEIAEVRRYTEGLYAQVTAKVDEDIERLEAQMMAPRTRKTDGRPSEREVG